MISHYDLVIAVSKAIDAFGDDCTERDSGVALDWAVAFFLSAPGPVPEDPERFLEENGASAFTQELFREIREFSGEGFTFGEAYDALLERAVLEATA